MCHRVDRQNDLAALLVIRVAHEEPVVLNCQRQDGAATGLLALAGDGAIPFNFHMGRSKWAKAHLYLCLVQAQICPARRGVDRHCALELLLGDRKRLAGIRADEARAFLLDRNRLREHARGLRDAAGEPLHEVKNRQRNQKAQKDRQHECQAEGTLAQRRGHRALQLQRQLRFLIIFRRLQAQRWLERQSAVFHVLCRKGDRQRRLFALTKLERVIRGIVLGRNLERIHALRQRGLVSAEALLRQPHLARTSYRNINGDFLFRHRHHLCRADGGHVDRGNRQRGFTLDGVELGARLIIDALRGDVHAGHQLARGNVFDLVQRDIHRVAVHDRGVFEKRYWLALFGDELRAQRALAFELARLTAAVDKLCLNNLVGVDAAA